MDGAAPSPDPQGLALTLEDVAAFDGRRRLRASARAINTGRLDALGVRLHLPDADRLLADGYHSWDWAGLRDLTCPGAAWWGAIVGSTTSPHAVRIRLERPPDLGALRLRWCGEGALDLLTVGPPEQEWERSGQPTGLGILAPESVIRSDAVVLSAFDANDLAGAALPAGEGLRRPGPREVGWMSWNCRGPAVTAGDVRAAAALVGPKGVVLVDDGWEERWGDWQEAPRFESTLAELASDLLDRGVRLGCWLAPFLADPSSAILDRNPGWRLRDDAGEPVVDRRPALPQHVLNASLPEVRRHLAGTGRRLAESGVTVLKLDFLYAGAASGHRSGAWTGMRALRVGMEALVDGFRGAAGPRSAIWLCGAPAPPLVGLGDACRSGADAVVAIPGLNAPPLGRATFAHGPAIIRAQERNLEARAWLWGATLPPDVDAVSLGPLRDTPPVGDAAAHRWLDLAERAGGPLLDADVELTAERRALLRASQDRVRARRAVPARLLPPLAGAPAPPGDDHFLSQPES
ncbi:MAG: hypothetical protein NVSMB29_17410 [Candidatus Dormibacteria bacterium]